MVGAIRDVTTARVFVDFAFSKRLNPTMGAFIIGRSEIVSPSGWSEIERTDDRLKLQSEDGKHHTTISVMHFASDPSLEDFKRLCEIRYQGERQFLRDGFMEPDAPKPFVESGLLGMFFSGGDKSDGRLFSGYLSLVRKELLTVYVEGQQPPSGHFECFAAFVKGIRRH
jgi:hypothetical protein